MKKECCVYLVMTFTRGIRNCIIACFDDNDVAQEFCKTYNEAFPELKAISKEKAYVYKRILYHAQPTQKQKDTDAYFAAGV